MKHKELRGFVCKKDIYFWNAFDLTHFAAFLELKEIEYIKDFQPTCYVSTDRNITNDDWSDNLSKVITIRGQEIFLFVYDKNSVQALYKTNPRFNTYFPINT